LILGDTLDVENIKATYEGGVLTLRIPVAEKAKPRKIEIETKGDQKQMVAA
jgi:HSP20 family protein